MLCPGCGSKNTGKVGVNQFYCWECFIEFNDKNETFMVEEDGSLVGTETPVYSN
ncbi:hypothetical protein MFMK1_003029 [Metallumcola ferriviriculae]|uniref:Uncharacterized protein n=1 Tax=Metallumcola ferriviriculae TaxID=3039180 RepID=A0AAU0USE9_9FIRM|nr:hypothetical protein MFMK1_003029 [Desulfitibacteraceae bacterium MK1]